MKANELMIGDWVYDTILKGNTKVELLSMSGIRGDYHDNVWDEKTFDPIPLTSEILERNGWYSHNTYGKWEHNKVDFYLQLCIEGSYSISVHADEYGTATFACVKYVHELQHLCRIFGYKQDWLIEQTDEPDWSLIEE